LQMIEWMVEFLFAWKESSMRLVFCWFSF